MSIIIFVSIGKRNYRFFFQFLAFLCLYKCVIFPCCLVVCLKSTPLVSPSVIASICLLVIIGLLIFPIGGLFIFHVVLISKGRTTNEHVTGKYKGNNFFTRGVFNNFMYLFYGSMIPQYKTVNISKKKLLMIKDAATSIAKNNPISVNSSKNNVSNKNDDIELGQLGCNINNMDNHNASDSEQSNRGSISDNDETTNMRKSLSNANVKVSQEQELLDVVLKNKKLVKNNRKTSVSESSVSSAMLKK